MSRPTAGERVRRLLALIPWLTAHSPAPVEEVCRRFGITRAALLADLEVLPFVGVPPYTPDTMIDVDIDDAGLISVRLAEPFDRPLRLTAPQALALVAAGRTIRDVPGADPGDPLQRALAKVATALGIDPERVQIELGDAEERILDELGRAATTCHQVEIDYLSFGTDERTRRVVDPHRLYADRGNWYLVGWCHRSEDVRVFRVDRIDDVVVLDATFEAPEVPDTLAVYRPSSDDPRVTLRLDPSARWVVEQYPHEHLEERPDGRLDVTLAVSARRWLERLLLRLGPAAEVVTADGDLPDAGADAARRVLRRYGGAPGADGYSRPG
ncbi:helix-turn-helix transcriptional regulator [Actinomarinicola tropica]|uniref:WYL domain-containing protein n=1 Tax=Actinomarinicola tropica TaxID=2789776 RepID=A0A5Q2RL40_9ACTN|nr:WYL domain-containing protein [Actinomarinicola tropica]QGG95291.1 WYL domain-containing protein [Actinomarinicola tropica]